jgi:hypothetical protein
MMIAPDTATALGFGDRPPARQVRLIKWRPMPTGKLKGFADVELLPTALKIFEIPIRVGANGQLWAALPAKPQIDRDGRVRTSEEGKRAYVAVLQWRDRELGQRFSEAVIAAVRRRHPADLE